MLYERIKTVLKVLSVVSLRFSSVGNTQNTSSKAMQASQRVCEMIAWPEEHVDALNHAF